VYNCNESMGMGFERIISCVTSVISLDFCTDFCKSFENVHLTCENRTKANNITVILFTNSLRIQPFTTSQSFPSLSILLCKVINDSFDLLHL